VLIEPFGDSLGSPPGEPEVVFRTPYAVGVTDDQEPVIRPRQRVPVLKVTADQIEGVGGALSSLQ